MTQQKQPLATQQKNSYPVGDNRTGLYYGYIIVLVAFFTMVVMWGTVYGFGVFFKPLSAEFGWTRAVTSGAYSMFMFVHGILYTITGRLNDKFGPRIVMTACGFLLGLGYLLMSQISAVWQIYVFYGLIIAAGASGGFVPVVSTIARWFVKRRGLMTGITIAGIGVGTTIVPPVASWLIESYGWRTCYIIVGITSVVVIVTAAQFLKREPSQMGLVPYGAAEVKAQDGSSPARGLALSQALRTKQFWMISALFLCFGFGSQSIIVHIVPHVTDVGISAIVAASVLSVNGLVSIAGRLVMGSASDRLGARLAIIICFIIMGGALSWVIVAREVWMFYFFAALFGFSYGGKTTAMSLIVAELFGLKAHGAILGVMMVSTTFGGAMGSILSGYIFDVTGSYRLAFVIGVALSAIGLILSLLLRPRRKE